MHRLPLILLVLFLTACAGQAPKPASLIAAPPKDEAVRTELKQELSTLSLTLDATVSEIADQLNRIVPRELYKGSTKTKGVAADIFRNGPIAVTASDNYLYLSLPVSVSLSCGMFETPAFSTRLRFRVNATVTSDWRVNADVAFTGLADGLEEQIRIGLLSVKPRSIVEGLTQPLQSGLSALVNRKLNETLFLKNAVSKAWFAAQKPVLVDETFRGWLAITPKEVLLYPLVVKDNRVTLRVGVTSYARLVVGPEPSPAASVPLPPLKYAAGGDRSFRVAVNTDLRYREILEMAGPLLLNREFNEDGRKVTVRNLELYGNGERLTVKVETTGDLEGTVYLTCRPALDPQSGRLSVEEVDFDLQSKSLLLQSADWFLHGTIRSAISDKLNMDLTRRLQEVRQAASKALERVNLAENVILTGKIKTMGLNDLMVQKDRLSIQLVAAGETTMAFR